MNRRSLLIVLSVMFWAGHASANGGPVDWTEPGGTGGIMLLPTEGIALVSEDLSIVIRDLENIHVDATYTLRNSGDERTLEYGVPVIWGGDVPDVFDEEWDDEDWAVRMRAEVERGVASIQVQVGEEPARPCRRVPTWGPGFNDEPVRAIETDHRRWDQPMGLLSAFDEFGMDTLVKSWCVTRITIPAGDSQLRLTYDAQLWFVDSHYSKSPFPSMGPRHLTYLLFPAGYWGGTPERVDIRVDLGPYSAEPELVFPTGYTRSGNVLEWHLLAPELSQVPVVEVALDDERRMRHQTESRWNIDNYNYPDVTLRAEASATAPGYDTAALFDGDTATAWCGPRDARLTIWGTFRPKEEVYDATAYPELQIARAGPIMVPGHTASQETYAEHGRPTRVRLSMCDDQSSSAELTATDRSPHFFNASTRLTEEEEGASAWLEEQAFPAFWAAWVDKVREGGDAPPTDETICLNLEILELAGGRSDWVCLSEWSFYVEAW